MIDVRCLTETRDPNFNGRKVVAYYDVNCMQNDVMAGFWSDFSRCNSELVPQWGIVCHDLKGQSEFCSSIKNHSLF